MTFIDSALLPGDVLENPVTGERFAFTATAASTRWQLLAFDFTLRPGGAVPVPHVHPVKAERFEVVEGRPCSSRAARRPAGTPVLAGIPAPRGRVGHVGSCFEERSAAQRFAF